MQSFWTVLKSGTDKGKKAHTYQKIETRSREIRATPREEERNQKINQGEQSREADKC